MWSSLIILAAWGGVGGAKYKSLSCDFDIRDDPAAPRQRDREAGCDVCGERYVESGRRGEGGQEKEDDTESAQISRSQSIEEVGPQRGMQSKGSRSG